MGKDDKIPSVKEKVKKFQSFIFKKIFFQDVPINNRTRVGGIRTSDHILYFSELYIIR